MMLKVALLTALSAITALAQQGGGAEQVNMAEMMAKARKYTQPGEAHKALERFLGDWTVETRILMGGNPGKPSMGEQRCTWLMKDRWVECRGSAPFMGIPTEMFSVLGYDNFKQSYRVMTMSSIDTAMNVSEGDMDPGGKVLLTYGTIDEYLTGEHDKMVKYVWRFDDADHIRMEVHDLPIGEKNTQVIAVRYTRKGR